MPKPELLAPAGDWKSFIAAVEAGADGVYFGGKDFSARNFAINLTREEIQKAIDYAHLRGAKCYAAVNILVKDNEFAGLFDYINFLYAEGIDSLIVQDLGVFNFCQKYWPDLPLHASTQMTAHNLNDILILEKMGFKRAVLARELTLEEIREIKSKSKIKIECFVHGALCFSYSGQCLLSSMIGGRSGNRGKCAQPCRKKYTLVDGKNGENLNIEGYLLSAKDLCALDILDKMRFTPALKQCNSENKSKVSVSGQKDFNYLNDKPLVRGFIDSLKIEGRMKGAAYVGGAVGKYRKAIESAARNEKLSPEEIEADKKEMAALFNRGGFSRGYLLDKKPKDLISPERSKNFGVLAGEVIEARNGLVKIRINDGGIHPYTNSDNDFLPIKNYEKNQHRSSLNLNQNIIKNIGVGVNDGLEIWGREGQEKNIGFRVEKISGNIVNIFIEGDVRVGDKVYKNYDYKLNKKLELLARENYQRKIKVKMFFRAEEGKEIFLKIDDAEAKGLKAEKALKLAINEKKIEEQLAKLGNTPFSAEKIDVRIFGKINIPLGEINKLRRECLAKLENKIINFFKREKKIKKPGTLIIPIAKVSESIKQNKKINICVQSDDLNVLNRLLAKKIFRVYTSLPIDIKKFHKNNIEVYQALPGILRKGEKLEIFENYDGFLAPALGYLRILPSQAKKIADFSLNIFNSFAVRELQNFGFAGFTASLENTLEEINSIKASCMEKETIVYGYLPLMISEHCVLRGTKYCRAKNLGIYPVANRDKMPISQNKIEAKPLLCENCANQEWSNRISIGIMDEKKAIFPILTDCANCRMRILNSAPLCFSDIEKLKSNNIRIIHTIESPEKIIKIAENYLSGSFGSAENITTGHFYRGVE